MCTVVYTCMYFSSRCQPSNCFLFCNHFFHPSTYAQMSLVAAHKMTNSFQVCLCILIGQLFVLTFAQDILRVNKEAYEMNRIRQRKFQSWNEESPINPPSPRFDTIHASNDSKLFVFSGVLSDWSLSDELWMLDLVNNRWNLLFKGANSSDVWPGGRRDGVGWLGLNGTSQGFYVSGGLNKEKVVLGDLWFFDIALRKWSLITRDDEALKRQKHQVIRIKDYMVVLAGENEDGFRRDLAFQQSNRLNQEWKTCDVSAFVSPRVWTTAITVTTNGFFVFGGVSSSGDALNDGKIVHFNPYLGVCKIGGRAISSNDSPSARSGHSISVIGDQIYIAGGEDADGNGLDDVWSYNMLTGLWISHKVESHIPGFLGAAIAKGYGGFAIFGGIDGWNEGQMKMSNGLYSFQN